MCKAWTELSRWGEANYPNGVIQSIRGEFVNNYFSSRNQQTQTNVAEDYFNCLIATSLWLTILFYPEVIFCFRRNPVSLSTLLFSGKWPWTCFNPFHPFSLLLGKLSCLIFPMSRVCFDENPQSILLGVFLKSNVYLLHFPKSKGWTQLNSSKTNFRFIKHNSKFTNDWYSLSYRSKIGSIFTVEQITHKLRLAIIQHKVIDVLMYLLMIVGVLL